MFIVYDFGLIPSELAGEKILMINEEMIDARIQIHGEPPSDLPEQRAWYQDTLRESLKLAAKTKLVLQKNGGPSSEQQQTPSNTPYLQQPTNNGGQSFNPLIIGSHTTDPPVPMGHQPDGVETISPAYLTQSNATSAPSSVMPEDVTDYAWDGFPQPLVEELVHSFGTGYNNFEGYGAAFDQQRSDIMGPPYQQWMPPRRRQR